MRERVCFPRVKHCAPIASCFCRFPDPLFWHQQPRTRLHSLECVVGRALFLLVFPKSREVVPRALSKQLSCQTWGTDKPRQVRSVHPRRRLCLSWAVVLSICQLILPQGGFSNFQTQEYLWIICFPRSFLVCPFEKS